MDKIKYVQEQMAHEKTFPDFKSGDSLVVKYKIIEGDKERIQSFKGDCIKICGEGATKTFTVRKTSGGVGVERIFPLLSPIIAGIEITKRGRVRRSKLYYLRNLSGKSARIKEKRTR